MAALGAELMLPGHGLPIAGRERIEHVLTSSAELLESLVDQTLELMNTGATLDEVVHGVVAPAHLIELPWLQPVYDEPEFVVRNLWRLYGGWCDGDPSQLKPAPKAELAGELASLAGGVTTLADRAGELSEAGEHRLACHLIELAAQAAPQDPAIARVRAQVYATRATHERSVMSKGVFSWARRESERTAEG
jgi:alkyl sulfatase BDS1-like metallo-beta-lactamase superfamily hydrolase